MSVITKTGDKGTSITAMGRIGKDQPIMDLFGDIDSVVAHIGLTNCSLQNAYLEHVQRVMFSIGASLDRDNSFDRNEIEKLTLQVHDIEQQLPVLTGFIIPARSHNACMVHVARTETRKLERHMWSYIKHIKEVDAVNSGGIERLRDIAVYLNRLSDYLFVLARLTTQNEIGREIYLREED